MRKIISFLLLSFVVYALQAQIKDPVKFKTELTTLSDTEAEVVFTATIDKGWHVYSTDLGDGGPISATFNVDNKSGVELVGKLKPVGKEVATFDKLFEMKVRYFENTAKFVQKVKFRVELTQSKVIWNMELVMTRVVCLLLRCRLSIPE